MDPNSPTTMVYRRTDIRRRIRKSLKLAVESMRSAEAEGQEAWRELAVHKIRVLDALLLEIDVKCPVFQASGLIKLDQTTAEVVE